MGSWIGCWKWGGLFGVEIIKLLKEFWSGPRDCVVARWDWGVSGACNTRADRGEWGSSWRRRERKGVIRWDRWRIVIGWGVFSDFFLILLNYFIVNKIFFTKDSTSFSLISLFSLQKTLVCISKHYFSEMDPNNNPVNIKEWV